MKLISVVLIVILAGVFEARPQFGFFPIFGFLPSASSSNSQAAAHSASFGGGIGPLYGGFSASSSAAQASSASNSFGGFPYVIYFIE
ncbi:hypothetical protein DMENIID0001_157840 [Sergentomyia squamirostris]